MDFRNASAPCRVALGHQVGNLRENDVAKEISYHMSEGNILPIVDIEHQLNGIAVRIDHDLDGR